MFRYFSLDHCAPVVLIQQRQNLRWKYSGDQKSCLVVVVEQRYKLIAYSLMERLCSLKGRITSKDIAILQLLHEDRAKMPTDLADMTS